MKTITGILQLRLVLQQQNLQAAQDFRQTQAGTQLQALLRLGTGTPGLRQIPELTMKLQAARNAGSNAMLTTLGKIRSVSQISRR